MQTRTLQSIDSSRSHQSVYATGLTNANLFQTDFAALERRQHLCAMQCRRTAVATALRAGLRSRLDLYRALYRTFRTHGLLRGMGPVVLILKRDAEALR